SLIPPERQPVRNILVPTGFSLCSKHALSYALGIGSRYEWRLYLFQCIDPTPYHFVEQGEARAACDHAARAHHDLLSHLHGREEANNVEIKVVVETDDRAAILAQTVNDLSLGLIVVGTHGRTGLRKAILGSVAEIVLSQAFCPVLSVGPSADRTRIQKF